MDNPKELSAQSLLNADLLETNLNVYFTDWKIPSIQRQRKRSNKSSATVQQIHSTNPFVFTMQNVPSAYIYFTFKLSSAVHPVF